MRRLLNAALAFALACTLSSTLAIGHASEQRTTVPRTTAEPRVTVSIPQCEEDEPYLRGKGDFDGTRWSRYVCVHIDDITRVPAKVTVLVGKDRINGMLTRNARERLTVLVVG